MAEYVAYDRQTVQVVFQEEAVSGKAIGIDEMVPWFFLQRGIKNLKSQQEMQQ